MRPPLFGYHYHNGNIVFNHSQYLETNKKVFEVAQNIVQIFIEQQSYMNTLKIINEKYSIKIKGSNQDIPRSLTNLKRWLRSPYLIGKISKEELKNTHTSFLTPDEIEQLNQTILSLKRTKKPKHSFSGKIFCKKCGKGMKFYQNGQGRYCIFRCSISNCDNTKVLSYKEVEEKVLKTIQENSIAFIQWASNDLSSQLRLKAYIQEKSFWELGTVEEKYTIFKEILQGIYCLETVNVNLQQLF